MSIFDIAAGHLGQISKDEFPVLNRKLIKINVIMYNFNRTSFEFLAEYPKLKFGLLQITPTTGYLKVYDVWNKMFDIEEY